jgi:Phytanoyl-CoA dioxygenase (PhyH)
MGVVAKLWPLGQTGGSSTPKLDETQQRLVESMRRDGIAVASMAELFGDGSFYETLSADIEDFIRSTESRLDELRTHESRKSFIVRRFSTKDGNNEVKARFSPEHPWLRFGIADRVLNVVNSYRGEHVHLISLDNWYTIPDPEAEDRAASQRWHRDPQDAHIVKVFVYFNHVDEDAGPFEYLRGCTAGSRYEDMWPWIRKRIFPPQDEFEQAIDPKDVLSVTGRAGTVIFADTAGFHRGGWARAKPRVLATYTYVSDQVEGGKQFKVDWSSGKLRSKQANAAIAWSKKHR